MKWIKAFEELKPTTYRSAARKLSSWNKSKRADKLEDWADENEYGIYNMHVAREISKTRHGIDSTNVKFTMPRLLGVYYGYDSGSELPVNLLPKSIGGKSREDTIEKLSNRMVDNWVHGDVSHLSIMLEFGLKPTRETLNTSGKIITKWNAKNRYLGNSIPMFRINLILTEEAYGLEGYYSYDKEEAEREGQEWEDPSIQEFYSHTKYEYLTLSRPFDDSVYGIFSDRKSALKFKNYFLSIVNGENEQLNGLDIKSVIMDVLTLVGGESNDIERIMNKLNSIRIHGLYDDELSDRETKYASRWFGNSNADTNPYGKTIN